MRWEVEPEGGIPPAWFEIINCPAIPHTVKCFRVRTRNPAELAITLCNCRARSFLNFGLDSNIYCFAFFRFCFFWICLPLSVYPHLFHPFSVWFYYSHSFFSLSLYFDYLFNLIFLKKKLAYMFNSFFI